MKITQQNEHIFYIIDDLLEFTKRNELDEISSILAKAQKELNLLKSKNTLPDKKYESIL